VGHELRVDRGEEAREERRRTEELAGPAFEVGGPEGGHQPARRSKPAVDSRDEWREQLTRYVVERVERDDGVERAGIECGGGEVVVEEARLRHSLAGSFELACGKVD